MYVHEPFPHHVASGGLPYSLGTFPCVVDVFARSRPSSSSFEFVTLGLNVFAGPTRYGSVAALVFAASFGS